MKPKSTLLPFLALAGSSLLAISSASAQTNLFWDQDGDASTATGGTGTWSTTDTWRSGTSTGTLGNWADNNIAVFGGTAGTVTLSAPVSAAGLTFSTANYIITGSTLTLAGASAPVINVSTGTSTISSDIAGTNGLEKTGAGSVILSGTNNTYSGTTTISAGTLQGRVTTTSLTPVSPFGSSSIQLNGGTLQALADSNGSGTAETITIGNNITVGGNATISVGRAGGAASGKTIALGNLSIGSNTLDLTIGNIGYTMSFTGANLTGNAVFNGTAGTSTTNMGAITETGGPRNITKSGSNTLRLTGTNTYTGTTTISAGTLQLGFGGATGSLTGTSGITNNGNLTVNRTNTFTQATDLNGQVITGTGSFTQAGSGITVLSLDNSYTGQTSISAGTLVVSKIGNYGTDGSIGKGTAGTSISMGSAASLVYTGTGENTDRSITFIAAGTGASNSVNVVNNGTGALNFTAAIFNTGASNSNNRYLTFGGTNGGTISGAIRDTGTGVNPNYGYIQLIKNGNGTWTMAGANNIMADTTLNAGTLKLDYTTNDNSKLGDVSTVGFLRLNGGTLELSGGTHQETVLSTTITNGTNFIKRTGEGASSKLLMGVITYTSGALDFSAAGIANVSTSAVTNGILSSAAGTARVTVGGVNWAAKDGSNDVIAYTGYTDFDGTASAANINYRTVGNATLTANRGATSNTFKITTSGSGQSMKLNDNFNLTLGSLLFAGADNYTIAAESGTGRINSAFLLHNYGAGTLTLGATNGAITQFGTGTTILNGNNAANVGINIFGGTVEFSDNLQIGTNASAQVISLNNGTLRANTAGTIALNSSGNFSRTVSLGAGGGTLDIIGGGTLTVSGAISSATASQLPTLTIGSASSNGTIELTGTNTYTGRTFISSGTLSVGTIGNGGVAGNLGQASNVAYNIVFDGGTLAHTGASDVSDRAFTITAGKTATINTTNNLSLAGATGIATTGALTKTGNGTLTLMGTSTYTGATNVNAGTLRINGSTSSTSLVTVNNGGTLGGTGTIGGSVTLNDGAFLSPGASIESLATGSNVWNGGSTFVLEFSTNGGTGAAGTEWDLLAITGTLDLSGASALNPINFDLVTMADATNSGLLGTWNPNASAVWSGFVTTTGGITGLNSNWFTFDTSGFQNTLNGNFSITQNGNNLNLVYNVVPEPRAALLGGLGLLVLLRRRP